MKITFAIIMVILMGVGGYCFGKVQELTEIQCVFRSVMFMLVYVASIMFTIYNNKSTNTPIKSVDTTQSYIHEPKKAL